MDIIKNVRDIAELIEKYNDQDLYERIVALRRIFSAFAKRTSNYGNR